MIKVLVKIFYEYSYIDDKKGSYEDIMYTVKNDFINYDDLDYCKKIVHSFLKELDISREVKKVKLITFLGERFYD
jgi:hypothetical protein